MSQRNPRMGFDDDEATGGRPGSPVDLKRVLRVLWDGKRWIVGALLVGAIAGVAIAKLGIQHTYVTSASVRYEGLPGEGFMEDQRELPALAAIANSERYLMTLRDLSGIEGANVDAMRAIVSSSSDPGTGLVSFTAYGGTPREAADRANAAVRLFLDTHVMRRQDELTAERASIAERIEAASAELSQARETYDTFREANGIVDLTSEQEQVIGQAAELRTRADMAAAEVQAVEARVAQLRSALSETPRMQEVATGTRTRSQARLTELRQRLREARGQGLGESHPQVQSLRRQVEALAREGGGRDEGGTRMGVNSEHERLQTNLADALAELESVRNRHQSLEQLAQGAQQRSNHFSDVESQAAGLLAQVNVKTALVESLTQRSAEIADQLRDVPTGFRSVAAAIPPESAVPSKKKKVVAAGMPLALALLVALILLFRNLKGLRLMSPTEVAWWGNGPVVGTSTWPRKKSALFDLVADLEDLTMEARGQLLVIGATESERKLAKRIAFELQQEWDDADTVVIHEPVPGVATPPGGIPHDPEDRVTDPLFALDIRRVTDSSSALLEPRMGFSVTTWEDLSGVASLRRAARRADGVLVVVGMGAKATDLIAIRNRIGREDRVAFLLLGVTDEIAQQPDRTGPVNEFLEAFVH